LEFVSSDGLSLAFSASNDGTLKLWDMASGKEFRTLDGHTAGATCVAIAPGGRAAISCSNDKTLKLWDFARGVTIRAFEPRVAAARAKLQQSSSDPSALATLGEWYAFQGLDQWAVDFFSRARECGAAVSPLTLGRCYWNLDRYADARREFEIALEQSKDPAEQTYLGWCIQRIDSEMESRPQ
jgi:uncharacterized protein HemY